MKTDIVIHWDSLDIDWYEWIYTISIDWDIFNYKWLRLKKQLQNNWYYNVSLSKYGKVKTFSLHRLIGMHFIVNENNYKCINHINGIKTDNRIENLEWCTHSQNNKHAYDIWVKIPYSNPWITNKSCKPILQMDLNKKAIKKWGSAREIYEKLWFNYKTISKCCNWYIKTSHGFIWKFI